MLRQELKIMVDVPKGWRAVDIRAPKQGEWFVEDHTQEPVRCGHSSYRSRRVIIEQVLELQVITLTIRIPEGYKLVHVRKPVPGDYYLTEGGVQVCDVNDLQNIYPILTPILGE